jgi:hypothetical protein
MWGNRTKRDKPFVIDRDQQLRIAKMSNENNRGASTPKTAVFLGDSAIPQGAGTSQRSATPAGIRSEGASAQPTGSGETVTTGSGQNPGKK